MFRALRADEIECRVAQAKENGVSLLLYKDARCDQSILDETVGPMGWQRHHARDNANCVVSIWDKVKEQWISKEDTGTESNTEKEKGLASDSFKRACFNWGIGRELYTAPFIWVKVADCTALKLNDRKKWECKDNFEVSSIKIENKRITELAIKNTKTGRECFTWTAEGEGNPASEKPEAPKTTPQSKEPVMFRCEECGEVLKPYKTADGVEIGVRRHANGSMKKYGKTLCLACIEKLKPQDVTANENTE